ncbi:Inositol-1-monophosphatase (EC [Lentimonas sp. CC4]|nr:Inositol-1-monophosphatase (EC [Lentimonas sp. CC4]CAA6683920.1 Inositol-1-monophosphatase (EC [Lentimonas sp. CC6]CAA7076702.1 Inositol-1-monophosphatase (EC [Lentimonas sp. CC4]CAA7169964.1 Inositol-1-monophosphatase (EC [Lentimonas sp. CC21]CAA7181253.1 Inositol-1-monophosphatase (EC [Lentimonas sp. CC8]
MRLCETDLMTLAGIAVTAVQEAGALIQDYAQRDVLVRYKAGGENLASQVVTEVDELSQSVILKHLLPTCVAYDLALLSEEQPDDGSRLEKMAFWCIDPLDGTLPFTESIPGYAVSIALVARDGSPLIGVVYDPTTGTQYQALSGLGVLRNGATWQLEARPDSAALQLIADRSLPKQPQFDAAMEQLRSIATACSNGDLETNLTGGAVMNALWVLERAPGCYFKFPKPQQGGGSLWDYAATACIYRELGAWCSDCSGRPLDLNRADSTFMNHNGVLYASDREMGAELLKRVVG